MQSIVLLGPLLRGSDALNDETRIDVVKRVSATKNSQEDVVRGRQEQKERVKSHDADKALQTFDIGPLASIEPPLYIKSPCSRKRVFELST